MSRRHFGLWYGGLFLTEVLATDAQTARSCAVASHERVPLCYPDYAPFEWYAMLARATAKDYGEVGR